MSFQVDQKNIFKFYKDENTRVQLSNDLYINANTIPGKYFNISQNFIATQGPLSETISYQKNFFFNIR